MIKNEGCSDGFTNFNIYTLIFRQNIAVIPSKLSEIIVPFYWRLI